MAYSKYRKYQENWLISDDTVQTNKANNKIVLNANVNKFVMCIDIIKSWYDCRLISLNLKKSNYFRFSSKYIID